MKYKELFTSENGLFQTVFSDDGTVSTLADEFSELFTGQTRQSMDSLAVGLYGNRTLLDYLTADNYVTFITAVVYTHLQSWKKLHDALYAEYGISDGQKIVDVKTGSITAVSDSDQTDTDSNKAFNEDEFSQRERHETVGNNDRTETYNELTNVRTITGDGSEVLKNIDAELKVRLFNLQRQMLSDIIEDICTDIY